MKSLFAPDIKGGKGGFSKRLLHLKRLNCYACIAELIDKQFEPLMGKAGQT